MDICQESTKECCEEEIVKNGDYGFDSGATIQSKLKNCSIFLASHITNTLEAKLSSWAYIDVRYHYLQSKVVLISEPALIQIFNLFAANI